MRQNRRDFVKTAGMAGALSMFPFVGARGANEQIRMAVCGVHGKGYQDASQFAKVEGVKVVAICDPDTAVLEKRVKDAEKDWGYKPEAVVDYRKILERKDIDAICIATPNHWHSLMAIQACQAGKDVYVEKPISHNVWEGRQLVTAAHKYGRIVQAGTQNRSDVGLREMYPWLHAGNIGKVKMVRGLCYRDRKGIGKLDKPLTPPSTVDYNLWLGPADDIPLYRPQFHYDWHWVWNTGNGDTGNQGPHEMDLMRWALGDNSLPTKVISFGGRFAWNDAGNTPNMHFTAYEYNGIPVYFETRNLQTERDGKAMPAYDGCRVGVVITCEGGKFVGGRGGGWIYDNDGKKMKSFPGDGGEGHQQNFIDAVRSRKESDLHAPVEMGHLGASLMHMSNISYQVGKAATPGELRELMSEDKEAMDGVERFSEQLAAWDIDYKKEPWITGVSLNFDPATEKFTGPGKVAKQANKLLQRAGRGEFVVPKTV